MESITVVRVDETHRYEARLGDTVVGFAAFRDRPGRVVFTHTETDPAYEGRGFGSQLAKGALDDVRARGLHVVPLCPFIHAYITRHPEYADLVVPGAAGDAAGDSAGDAAADK